MHQRSNENEQTKPGASSSEVNLSQSSLPKQGRFVFTDVEQAFPAETAAEEVMKELKVIREDGLHLRVANKIVATAEKYSETDITVTHNEVTASAHSIMQLSMLAAIKDSKVIVRAKGENKVKALQAVCKILETDEEL